jgi:hypothetical protein
MADVYVLFTDTNARIIKSSESLDELKKLGTVLVNPNMNTVKGIPPHHWKISDMGHVVPMTEEEKNERDLKLALVETKPHRQALHVHRPVIKEIPVEIEVRVPQIREIPLDIQIPVLGELKRSPVEIIKSLILLAAGIIIGHILR